MFWWPAAGGFPPLIPPLSPIERGCSRPLIGRRLQLAAEEALANERRRRCQSINSSSQLSHQPVLDSCSG